MSATGNLDPMAGQAVYSPAVLTLYDAWVLGISNHLIWRCPTRLLRELYDRNVSGCHLDVGVGTGYFLDRARWPVAHPEITLLDLNPNSLAAAARRIRRFSPRTVTSDVLKPLPLDRGFTSAGLNFLLHCLPGAIADKAIALDHVAKVLEPGARVFGSTIVQGDTPRSWAAQSLMDLYNRKGIFSNASDRIEDVERELVRRFDDVKVRRAGCVAIFEGQVRTPSG